MPSSNAFPTLSLPAVPKHPMVWHFPVQEDLLPFLLGKRLRKEFLVHRMHLRVLLGVAVPVCTAFHDGCTVSVVSLTTLKTLGDLSLTDVQCSESLSLIMVLTRLP